MKSLWHLGNSKQQQSILKEHQLHLQTHKKLLIAIFLFSLIYFLVDAVVCLHVNPEINYLTLILACSFQLVKLLLFFFYMRITTQNPDNKHSFFLEILFVFIFCTSTILTWNLQIDLDPSRIYIIGIETGWTFLYVHTLFGRWPWKAIIYVSAPLYGIYKMVMASQELSPGVCQAILQLALVIVSALIEESRKKQNVLESVSLEKTGQTLKNILNSLPDNIAILNLDGDIRFYNDFFGISFKLTDNVSSELLFSQIYQVKPRERHLNLQKIQEKYNFVRPTRKTIKKPNVNLSPTSRQSFAKAADSSSNTLMQYLTEELESANNKGNSIATAKKDKASLRRARSARFSQLPPLKTLTEFFSSINYFRDLQEVLDFMCLNVGIIRSYTEKERSFFIFDGKYKTSEGLNKSFEIKISLSNFDNEESFILILRDTTHRDIIVTLEDHNNFKDSVLSSLSHELKTPLNANLNLLQLAIDAFSKVTKNLSLKFPSYNGISEENYGTLIASETTLAKMDFKDSYLVPAHKSGKLLESLINDIVDYSMLLARKFAINVKQKYLNKNIEKILYMCEFQAQRKNLELRVNISPEINFKVGTDHKRLRQIVTNLINNAIKFTSKGFVSLDIEPYCDNSQLIQFTVKDSGIGIDKAGLERMTTILDAGNFLDKLNQESSGVGMGLVISHLLAKEIGPTAQRMSGIKIESTRNKGSKFKFVIENFVNGPPSPESKILDGTNLLHMQKEKARSDTRKGTLLLANIRGDSRKSTLFFGSSTETFPSRGDNKLKVNNNVSSITDRRDQTDDHVMIPISDINDRDIDEENAQMLKDANLRKSLLGESRLSKRESQFPSSFENKSIPLRLVFNGSESPSFANSGPRDFDGSPRTNMSRLVHNLDFFRNVLIPVPLSDSVEMIEKPPKSCMCPEILVADDDMFNLFTMETLFANFNIQIAKAIHGQQAIDLILKRGQAKCGDECKPFKLIFMDVSMPVMDGFETTLKLKEMMKNREISETPIIACTAFVEEEKVAKCFECGMEEKVSKPVSQNKLAEILKRYKIIEKIDI